MSTYPSRASLEGLPLFSARQVSKAARPRAGDAATLRNRALEALRARAMTADEVAAQLGESILTIRPRIAELAKAGSICDTGQRKRNESGKFAAIWRVRE